MQKILSPKISYWLKTLSKFASVQLVVQALRLASGILLIRNLDKQEYAYFTIAFGVQTSIQVLSDVGISTGILSIGGEVWQDKYRLSQLIKTAMQLKNYLAILTSVTFLPIMIWLLAKNEASSMKIMSLVLASLLGLYFQLSNVVIRLVFKLRSQIKRIQYVDLTEAISRLSVLLAAHFVFLNAWVALMASSITIGISNVLLTKWAAKIIDLNVPVNVKYRARILKLIKYQSPQAIFFSIKQQLTIWLVSIFGNAQSIADIGALGRLSIIFSILNSIMTNIIFPMFARCQAQNKLQKRYLQIIAILCLIVVNVLTFTTIFPELIMWFLGSKYSHLKNELFWMIFNFGLQYLVGSMASLNKSKGWVEYFWINIPMTIIWQICLLFYLDLSNIKGVIIFNILSYLPFLIINIFTTYKKLWRMKISM